MLYLTSLMLTCFILLSQTAIQEDFSKNKNTPQDSAPSAVDRLLSNQGSDQTKVQSEQIWGTVTRSNKDSAEFNISLKHGLWSGDILYVYRPKLNNKQIDKLYVKLVDDFQAVGNYKSMRPEINDRVLFLRKRPSTDKRINRLIGSVAELTYKPENATSSAHFQSVLILSLRIARDNEIESFHCVPAEPRLRTLEGSLDSGCDFIVPSRKLMTVSADNYKFWPDPHSGLLIAEEDGSKRSSSDTGRVTQG